VGADPAIPAEHARPIGGEFTWADTEPASPPRNAPLEIAPARGDSPSAFDALLKESERLEAEDPAAALDVCREILEKERTPGERAEARLRAIQLAARAGKTDVVREQLALAEGELDGREARDGISYLLLDGLAAAPKLDEPQREDLCRIMIGKWRAGGFALTGERERFVDEAGDGPFKLRLVPAKEALRDRLGATCGTAELAADLEAARAEALAGYVGPLPPRPDDDTWHAREIHGALFAWHRGADSRTRGSAFAWDDLGGALLASLAEHGALPPGFHVDFRGEDAAAGPVVRDRTPLSGDAFGFWLRHEDPESVARAAGRRLWFLRAALLGMAAFATAAGVATWRALRRERTLSEMRSAFVANVSHELRTPLASILLMAENLEDGRVGGEAVAGYHASIRREAGRLRRLVDDVLDFSRIERGKSIEVRAEETSLAGWIDDLRPELAAWAERARVELSIEVDALPEHAAIDGESLRRAVLNLLDNAHRHGRSAKIRFAVRAEDRSLVLVVADHGRGIPSARREEVFEPFVRLEDGGAPGAGLGLAIVREIARAHGGDARALEPADGEGAVFEIRIPLAADEKAIA
jgi:signal transduction histidine kinase